MDHIAAPPGGLIAILPAAARKAAHSCLRGAHLRCRPAWFNAPRGAVVPAPNVEQSRQAVGWSESTRTFEAKLPA
jgi:hypothetical protein